MVADAWSAGMRPFEYHRASNIAEATRLTTKAPEETAFLAGGTTVVDLAKLEVLQPKAVVDITPLQNELGSIACDERGLQLGSLVKMSAAARHPAIVHDYPVIAQSLRLAASAQIRNMATLGGNVLQRTRCVYFRDVSWIACNKREPGSGCAAIDGVNRRHAILGVSDDCIAAYAGDFAHALVALDASVELQGPSGKRTIPLESLHREPGSTPHVETTLEPGELITRFFVPAGSWTRRSVFVKIRDRDSYEFALASAAVAIDLEGGLVRDVRIGLGGVSARPWRSREAEDVLRGGLLDEGLAGKAAHAAFARAKTHRGNDYKAELGRRTLVRALLEAATLEL
jgi:xanthine dehydrogenase YagS FAD-binding subunit